MTDKKKIKKGVPSILLSIKTDWQMWIFLIPALVLIITFNYVPMTGIVMAFQDFKPGKGIFGSEFVGFEHFIEFFTSYNFERIIRNTFVLSFLPLLFGFPTAIIFALALNEVRRLWLKKVVQFASYLPYFISIVVTAGMVVTFLSPNEGIINSFIKMFGGEAVNFLAVPAYFPWVFTAMMVWKTFGFNSILYLAALSSVDPSLYEAAKIDGANKWQEVRFITFPCIQPTVVIMLLLGLGNLMRTGFEEIFLLYNEAVYETADVITTFVYRIGIETGEVSYATAIGLFNSVISFALLVTFNQISKKFLGISLW